MVPAAEVIQVEMPSLGAQLSPVPDTEGSPDDTAQVPFKPPSRLDIRQTSIRDFVPCSPNSARAKRSPKTSSYQVRYGNRINSPGSLMSPKSEAGALMGAVRDETTEENAWRLRVEPRVVRDNVP